MKSAIKADTKSRYEKQIDGLVLSTFTHRFRQMKILSVNLWIFSYSSVLTYVFGAQKSRLVETILLSTHNICFGWEIRIFFYWFALLTKGLLTNYLIFFVFLILCLLVCVLAAEDNRYSVWETSYSHVLLNKEFVLYFNTHFYLLCFYQVDRNFQNSIHLS